MIAAFAMRKLQALHLLAQPGVVTATDVLVTYVDSVLRALVEAPRSQLLHRATKIDWDQEWAVFDAGMMWRSISPAEETERHRELIHCLIAARETVIDVSEGRIRYFS